MTASILFRYGRTFIRQDDDILLGCKRRGTTGRSSKISSDPHPEKHTSEGRLVGNEELHLRQRREPVFPFGRRDPGSVVMEGPRGSSQPLAAVDYARFHDKGDAFEHADVFQWVTGHGDDVGVVARF
jgi:hypothetical protein